MVLVQLGLHFFFLLKRHVGNSAGSSSPPRSHSLSVPSSASEEEQARPLRQLSSTDETCVWQPVTASSRVHTPAVGLPPLGNDGGNYGEKNLTNLLINSYHKNVVVGIKMPNVSIKCLIYQR